MNRPERRLCVFLSAGATRYAIDAARVLEVARASAGALRFSQEVPLRELSVLLGGDHETPADAGVLIDSTPPLALQVKQVEGVFDCSELPRWPVQGRLIPLLAPAIGAALEHEGRLVFELDADGAARGLPRRSRPLERHLCSAASAVVFVVQNERMAIPLAHVVQVLPVGAYFNRSPNAGSFLGVAIHRARPCPIFTVGQLGLVEPFLLLFEVGGDLLGLGASQVEGVRSGASLEGVAILDVGRMFSFSAFPSSS